MTCLGFIVIHIFAIVKFREYGNEVLSSESHNSFQLFAYKILILVTFPVGFLISARIFQKKVTKEKKNGNEEWPLTLTAAVISINFIYVACYFFPYMLWAFIHNPFLTIFTHVMLVLAIVCLYLISLAFWRLLKLCWRLLKLRTKCKNDNGDNATKCLNTILFCCMVCGITFSVAIFLYVSTSIITLGRFGDFEELNSLAPSLLIAVVGLFLLKPVYNHVTGKIKCDKKSKQGGNNGKCPTAQ